MAAQGRQYAQITFLDTVVRTWRQQGLVVNLADMALPRSRARIKIRNLPPGHVAVSPELVSQQFAFWWQFFLWICDYVYERSADRLPSHEDIDTYITSIGGEDYMSSYLEEEVAAIKLMTDRYRNGDPAAAMDRDEALVGFAIPALIRADRHWVSDPHRRRPGSITPDHDRSLLRGLLARAADRRDRGWELTDLEQMYVRVAEILTELEERDPEYGSIPTYRKLITEYNAAYPDSPVRSMHEREARRFASEEAL